MLKKKKCLINTGYWNNLQTVFGSNGFDVYNELIKYTKTEDWQVQDVLLELFNLCSKMILREIETMIGDIVRYHLNNIFYADLKK